MATSSRRYAARRSQTPSALSSARDYGASSSDRWRSSSPSRYGPLLSSSSSALAASLDNLSALSSGGRRTAGSSSYGMMAGGGVYSTSSTLTLTPAASSYTTSSASERSGRTYSRSRSAHPSSSRTTSSERYQERESYKSTTADRDRFSGERQSRRPRSMDLNTMRYQEQQRSWRDTYDSRDSLAKPAASMDNLLETTRVTNQALSRTYRSRNRSPSAGDRRSWDMDAILNKYQAGLASSNGYKKQASRYRRPQSISRLDSNRLNAFERQASADNLLASAAIEAQQRQNAYARRSRARTSEERQRALQGLGLLPATSSATSRAEEDGAKRSYSMSSGLAAVEQGLVASPPTLMPNYDNDPAASRNGTAGSGAGALREYSTRRDSGFGSRTCLSPPESVNGSSAGSGTGSQNGSQANGQVTGTRSRGEYRPRSASEHALNSGFPSYTSMAPLSKSLSGYSNRYPGLAASDRTGAGDRTAVSSRSSVSSLHSAAGSGSEPDIDYKKLYEKEREENEKLRKRVNTLETNVTQLEKQKDMAKPSLVIGNGLLSEKDRRSYERRIAELEEETKILEALKADNQRLKEENGALIRVISKLSK